MEFLLVLVILLACLVLPETQSEKDAVENRRLRKQRQGGNFNATPRTRLAPEKYSIKDLYNDLNYTPVKTVEERLEIAKNINDWEQSLRAMYAIKMGEAKTLLEKDRIWNEREAEIAKGAGAYYRKYGI